MNQIISAALDKGRAQLNEVEAKQLLASAGVPVAQTQLATNSDEAVIVPKSGKLPPDITVTKDFAIYTNPSVG